MSPHPSFVLFASDATESLARGSDALLYVMAHGHTISVPTAALYFAEKIGVLSIGRRDTPETVLRAVNKALDVIASALRMRDRLDREITVIPALHARTPEPPNEGPMARLSPRPINRPPSGQKVEIAF